ncbi:hypothetical protein ACIQUZ_10560 [Streptomyces griseus]|uniref:hypothetical protein n=1 Tax=Streptomyces griseus TaxID=1911 RepID=UPI0037F4DCB7
MRRARASGPVHTGFRAALSLVIAVVALLCVVGHGQRDSPAPRSSAAELTRLSESVEAPSGAAAPCGKKAVADQSAQRAENTPVLPGCPDCATADTTTAAIAERRCGSYAGGPAPPPPPLLSSVLRI